MSDRFTEIQQHVEHVLVQVLAEKLAYAARVAGPDGVRLVESIEGLTLRAGKRLRPILTFTAASAIGRPFDGELVYRVGAAIELLQTFLLIHDDWMDGDSERRGGPTAHVALSEQVGNEHLGASLAILAGDMACAFAWEVLTESIHAHPRARELTQTFGQMKQDVCFGQALDLVGSEDITRMHALKTSSYTTVGPLRLGGLIAGGSDEQLHALQAFSVPVGGAFQIRDDLLGVFGDEAKTGKPVGSDLRRGKHSAVYARARQTLQGPSLEAFSQIWGDADADQAMVTHVVEMLRAAGVERSLDQEVASLVEAGNFALRGHFNEVQTKPLIELAERLAFRDK